MEIERDEDDAELIGEGPNGSLDEYDRDCDCDEEGVGILEVLVDPSILDFLGWERGVGGPLEREKSKSGSEEMMSNSSSYFSSLSVSHCHKEFDRSELTELMWD